MSKESGFLNTRYAKAEESPGFLLWKAANLLQRSHARCLSGVGLTPSQASLMMCLVHMAAQGVVTPTRIAARSGMDKMLVSDLIAVLERKGLLRKSPNPADRRSIVVVASDAGVRAANEAVALIEADDRRFFAQVADMGALHNGLADLVARHGGAVHP